MKKIAILSALCLFTGSLFAQTTDVAPVTNTSTKEIKPIAVKVKTNNVLSQTAPAVQKPVINDNAAVPAAVDAVADKNAKADPIDAVAPVNKNSKPILNTNAPVVAKPVITPQVKVEKTKE